MIWILAEHGQSQIDAGRLRVLDPKPAGIQVCQNGSFTRGLEII